MMVHALCSLLPELTVVEFNRLADDIRANGLLRPITTYDGQILDGRHRFRACEQVNVAPRFEPYTGDDPAAFVMSTSIHRNISTTQRALFAAGLLEYEQAMAKDRMREGGGDQRAGVENFPPPIRDCGKARDKAGARVGISGRSVSTAVKVLAKATPAVVEQMKTGDMTLNEAKKVVEFNANAQNRIAQTPKRDRAKAIELAQSRSAGCKRRDNPKPLIPEADGTPLVRTLLSGIERLSMYCAEKGMKTPSTILDGFNDGVDWDSAALVAQFHRCEPVILALWMVLQSRRLGGDAGNP